MPGEYGEGYGEWSFDCLNAEGYIAETSFDNDTRTAEDGYATIYGYSDTQKESRLKLSTSGINVALQEITVAYFLKINGGAGLKLSIGAKIDNTEKRLLIYEVSDDGVEVSCEGEALYKLKLNEWNRYVLRFDLEKGIVGIYIDSKLIKTLKLGIEDITALTELCFIFKSENFEDFYALDEVGIIY